VSLLRRRRDVEPSERALAAGLAAGRLAIGAGIWLAPRLSLRALGFSEPSTQALTLARIAGARDLALGAWQLRSLDDRDELARATFAVAACDAGDSIAFALALGSGETRAGLRGVAGAVPATAAGLALASRLRR
jgi:hypothetical protein